MAGKIIDGIWLEKRRKCVNCNKLTYKWQRINGGAWHCYDGCKSTTGVDYRKLLRAKQ